MGQAGHEMSVDAPRVLSLDSYAFNFTVSAESRLRARIGAPAFAVRRRKLDLALDEFWNAVERRNRELWIAAGEGRIAEDGREVRQVLLDEDGRDRLGEMEHRWRVFRDRADPETTRADAFDRAWLRYLDHCGLERLEAQVSAYNRYFPIEANLPADPETGRYRWMGGFWEPMDLPTRDDVLARFPLRRPT